MTHYRGHFSTPEPATVSDAERSQSSVPAGEDPFGTCPGCGGTGNLAAADREAPDEEEVR